MLCESPQATVAGLGTGARATSNGLAKAGKTALTLGLYDNYTGVFAYSDFDIAVGAHLSENIANASGSIIIGAAAGGAGCVGGRIGQAAKLYDLAGNAVDSARAGADMYTNGVSITNTLQMAGAVGGGVANGLSKCFTEGTQVVVWAEYTEDDVFVQYVTVNIEDVQVGDLVYSYDTTTGEVSPKEVTAVFVRETDHLNYLTFVDEQGREQVIETTDGHPFWVVTDDPDLERAARSVVDENGVSLYHDNVGPTEHGFWVEAKDLREGDVFIGANGEFSTLVAKVRVEFDEAVKVYNFTVDGNHDYFVIAKADEYGQTCILVHNAEYTITARRFMGKPEYKNVKKNGLHFDPSEGNGIPATTTTIKPVNPDRITDLTGANNASHYMDFDITDIPHNINDGTTRGGLPEIIIKADVPPSLIIGGGRVQ